MFEWLRGSTVGWLFTLTVEPRRQNTVLRHFDCGAMEPLQTTLFKSGPVCCSLAWNEKKKKRGGGGERERWYNLRTSNSDSWLIFCCRSHSLHFFSSKSGITSSSSSSSWTSFAFSSFSDVLLSSRFKLLAAIGLNISPMFSSLASSEFAAILLITHGPRFQIFAANCLRSSCQCQYLVWGEWREGKQFKRDDKRGILIFLFCFQRLWSNFQGRLIFSGLNCF